MIPTDRGCKLIIGLTLFFVVQVWPTPPYATSPGVIRSNSKDVILGEMFKKCCSNGNQVIYCYHFMKMIVEVV